ncbi:MAG: PIN domain nuclease [Anaerolineaceae bacterium]|nr:PIN domain nuclease [Anaerolineaceae bacterium]
MILVDTSVWIDYFNGRINPFTDYLDRILTVELILVGDIILAELLQGIRSDDDFKHTLTVMQNFGVLSMLSPNIAIQSAHNYRYLRSKGITVRKTIDSFIATFCIEHGYQLLHNDRDFDPFASHLSLKVVDIL